MLTSPPGYQLALLRDLEEWRERLSAVTAQIRGLETERDDINKRVMAAEILLGTAADGDASLTETMRDGILKVMQDGRVRKPKDIRRELLALGMDPKKLTSHSGAFYNALVRLVASDRLMKTEDSRYWDPSRSAGPIKLEDMLK